MYANWRDIERALRSKVAAAGPRGFCELAHARGLVRFPDADILLRHLHERDGSDAERDHLLAELVVVARGRDRVAALGRDILWLAMWPGLTALLRRAVAWGVEDEGELAGEIALRFAETIEDVDLASCSRVAATLILNTRRGLVEMVRGRSLSRDVERADLMERAAAEAAPCMDVGAAMEAVAELSAREPEDAELVLACVVEGVTTREVAARCGSEREAVKKRLRRALLRLRSTFSADDGESAVPSRPENPLIEGEEGAIEEESDEPNSSRISQLAAAIRGREPAEGEPRPT